MSLLSTNEETSRDVRRPITTQDAELASLVPNPPPECTTHAQPKPRATRATIGSTRAVSCFTIGREEERYQGGCENGVAGSAVMTTL